MRESRWTSSATYRSKASESQGDRVLGPRLLPPDDARVPKPHGSPSLSPGLKSVAIVEVRGTNYSEMAERARAITSHQLRLLRIALRDHPWINQQLRFRIGRTYAFDDRLAGWNEWDDAAWGLDLSVELVELADSHVVTALPLEATSEIEEKVEIAVRWMDRAWFAGDPLIGLLYLFFALEALLGDKSEGLKGKGLAFRQAMLSAAVTGAFEHPNKTLFLHEKVRSAAVHGGVPSEIDDAVTRGLRSSMTRTLNHYLTYAREEGVTTRAATSEAVEGPP
jgi:hypothetical protein